jgi:hypothetical protein
MLDSIVDDFYDVQRYALSPGVYNYELVIKDMISGESVSGDQSVSVTAFNSKEVFISDVDFISDAYKSEQQNNFVKNGFFMLPYLTNYFPPDVNKIAFYFEVYNANKYLGEGQPYMLTIQFQILKMVKPSKAFLKFNVSRVKVTPVIAFLPIESLPSGEYDLQINLIDKNSDTLTVNQFISNAEIM